MDLRAYRIAQEFVKGHLRIARYSDEFLKWTESQTFRNPETGRDVQFLSLPTDEQIRIHERWKTEHNVQEGDQKQAPTPAPKSREQIIARNLEIARNGVIKDQELLSSGGIGQNGPVNQSFIVSLEDQGQKQQFIYKPAEGEEPHLRIGIPSGQYHAREQAAYALDTLMGGDVIVPVTQSRGKESGSFQLWAEGAGQLHGTELDELVKKVPLDDIPKSPDFQRLNVLDLIIGHQDRHRGNLLYSFNGDEKPENLRLIAIDNGLSLSSPANRPEHVAYINPFADWYGRPDHPDGMSDFEEEVVERKLAEKTKEQGNKLVGKSLSNLDPKTIEAIRKINLTDAAKAITGSGIDEEGAVRATLVRIAALQTDPTIFRDMLHRSGGDLNKAWTEFQHLSGYRDDLLWRSGAGEEVEQKINQAISRARPKGGWSKAPDLEAEQQAIIDLAHWGEGADPGAGTVRQGPGPGGTVRLSPGDADLDWSKVGYALRDRWLLGKVTDRSDKSGTGRKLTVSYVNPRDRSHTVVGEFELDRHGKVKESYKDWRFRNDIQSGIRLMGKRIVPKDGPLFMGALEKVYGARTMYEVKRT